MKKEKWEIKLQSMLDGEDMKNADVQKWLKEFICQLLKEEREKLIVLIVEIDKIIELFKDIIKGK